ncbi:hypothetical protein PN466_21830 [Roseofilum reptotaenium CS-1145]|uniref:Uncharacterized protein n=1 Tax=Roseofilum reptotaenium AO1-A TaxID=1925591 RepID=A0A1L9QSJ6_9CYAN|nr:hypothetical protein [Roseofilum reptotaenium]MDB9519588.1 hypothetical protein [Roseofilum reptotaenium CS-1145]OJJ25622.1 hypothetical protein BI308_10775 [Roseofilum reptotaenium AO1-A]
MNELESTLNKSKLERKLQALDWMVSPVINLIAESVVLYSIDEITVPNLRDPDDNILLVLEAYQGISMMTAKDFWQRYFESN